VPTDFPESDGTLEWDSTTLVLVELNAGNSRGLGYTYASQSCANLIRETLFPIVQNRSPLEVRSLWDAMVNTTRNLGRPGLTSCAIAAVDTALWDTKARLLHLSAVQLLGQVREAVPVYGSGGFTSYSMGQLREQLGGWVKEGISRVKMKIGREPRRDLARVGAAREAIGETTELFVDANGAYSRKQALEKAGQFADFNVTWFEEPVPSDDLAGLRLMRDRAPAGMEIAAGEYGYDAVYFRRMLESGAVDVLQADATRCAGATGFLQAAALCDAFLIPLSAHTAPSLHAHLCCAVSAARHVEYFHDHTRIEQMFFDGAAKAAHGQLRPDLSRPGWGLEFKRADAERFRI
jgi:L-alanine-DL-glutamate epimerase-like enolase superfamily enzyme